MNKELKHLEGEHLHCFKISISYIPLVSSPTPGQEAEEDPWADKTAEISFGGQAAPSASGELAVRGEGDGEAVDSSDEENDAAPDKMEVDNDQDGRLSMKIFLMIDQYFVQPGTQ